MGLNGPRKGVVLRPERNVKPYPRGRRGCVRRPVRALILAPGSAGAEANMDSIGFAGTIHELLHFRSWQRMEPLTAGGLFRRLRCVTAWAVQGRGVGV